MTIPTGQNWPQVNQANLRDLIAATSLVILLKLDSNRQFFHPMRTWNLMDDNRAPFLHYFKLCASLQIHQWIQTGVTVRKFYGRPWKTIRNLIYAAWSFVHDFVAVGEFKLEIQSRNAQFVSKWTLFFNHETLKFWRMTMKNKRAPLLNNVKLCASFHPHMWIQTGITIWKRKMGFWTLWSWTLTLTFCRGITFVNGNNSWKFHDDVMTGTLWKRCRRWSDGRMDR